MSWIKAITTVLVLWSGTAWGATLTWDASSGPNLAGYRVYNCSQLPCSPSAATATLLATLGTGTSFNIGTPGVVQYYVVTAYNSANIESSPSSVATYTPSGTSTSPPTVTLTVLGSPAQGQPWTVQAYPANVTGTVSVEFWINNDLDHIQDAAPYCAFAGADSANCRTALRPFGSYTIEARVRSNGIEVTRQAITVQASATPSGIPPAPPAPPATSGPTVTLTVLGSPTQGQPWTVQAYPANVAGTVSVEYWINNDLDHIEQYAPYCAFVGADGANCRTALRPFGSYTIEARVRSNGIEVVRQAVTVQASTTPSATSGPTVTLTVLGSPTQGQPWTVQAYLANATGTVSVQFWINNTVNRVEGFAPYCPFDGADDGVHCLAKLRPFGFYTIEARVVSNGTEVTRQVIVVKAGSQ
ncbi:MAG: hypothetical protein P0119_12440 [Nitrospira sp.]|nr:hypothetical protein [Nitrospira sp.]